MNKLSLLFFVLALVAACGAPENKTMINDNRPTETPVGSKIFQENCITCHGAGGDAAINGAKNLKISALSMEERINRIANGKGLMTPFKNILSEAEIKAVAEYTMELKN